MNKFNISIYKLIVARIYSSGERCFIIMCVSYKRNTQNKKAPATDITNSKPVERINRCKIAAKNIIHNPEYKLKKKKHVCLIKLILIQFNFTYADPKNEKSLWDWNVYNVKPARTAKVNPNANNTRFKE